MNKIIVVSGGSDGLGKAIAKRLASEHIVIILSPSQKKLQAVAESIESDYECCDVSKYDQVEQAIAKIINRHKRIDCVINNAGVWLEGELDNNDPEQIRKTLEVNTLGTIYLTKAVLPLLKKQGGGLIVNIISQSGLYAKPLRSVYNASKWAVTGFTKTLQQELKKYEIGVTGIYPSKLKTKMFEKAGINKDLSDALDPEEVAETIAFILSRKKPVVFPEIGIKHIKH